MARAALRGALDIDSRESAKPLRGSLDTLSAEDRAPPWRGPADRRSF